MEFQENVLKATLLMICVSVCSSFVLVKSDESDGQDVENKVLYLLDLLQKMKQFTESDYHSEDVPAFNDFITDSIPKRVSDEGSRRALHTVDDTYARFINIHKKDFAILPPANEWCRMMGFRRCRQSHS